jgi:hypothetical protein
MYEFLLERRHLNDLDEYLKFLGALPQALERFQRFSAIWKKKGHIMMESPDARRLRALSEFSSDYIKRIGNSALSAKSSFEKNLNDVLTFFCECRTFAYATPGAGRKLPIRDMDFRLFSLSQSQYWMLCPPTEMRGLTHELYLRLFKFRSELIDFKYSIKLLNEDIHGIFARFVHFLNVHVCKCHRHRSFLESSYSSGIGLFSGALSFTASSYEGARLAQAQQHLREISSIYLAASSAINNLNDFLFAMLRFLDMAQQELVGVKSSMSLSRLLLLLSEVVERMQDIKSMLDRMQQWSRK